VPVSSEDELQAQLDLSRRRGRGDARNAAGVRIHDGRLLAVEISTHPGFRAGRPTPLESSTQGAWDSAADGSRFLKLSTK
jgi:hypothetical protein